MVSVAVPRRITCPLLSRELSAIIINTDVCGLMCLQVNVRVLLYSCFSSVLKHVKTIDTLNK